MSLNRKKNPVISGILSFFFPGAGQFYNEDFVKGVILIAGGIASIISIVYTALTLVNQGGYQVAVPIVKIVTASLILFGIWLYGIIDAIIFAQRSSTLPDNTAESVSTVKTKEGTIALGVVLVLFGIICIAVQLGLKYEYLVKYGLPAALILFGGYLLAKTSGLIKGGK